MIRRSAPAFDVAIVGLGPTGAVLANLCGAAGLRVVVFERSRAAFAQPRACHLDAEIARVLQQCGLGAALPDVLTVSAGMEYVSAEGERLFTFEGFERAPLLGWHEDYVFVQPELDALVRSGLHRWNDVEVHLGVEAPSLEALTGLATWVVACDGASSPVRTALGIELIDRGYDEEWLVVDLFVHDDAPPLPTIIQQVCSPSRLATFVPSHGAHRRWEFRVDPDESPDPWDLCAPWGVHPGNSSLVRSARYRFHALVAERWREGNIFLAGDAAHQMPPFMGQGMCSGIRDAANLWWKFDTPSLLDSYEAERRPHLEAVIDLSIQAGQLLGSLAADVAAGRALQLPAASAPDPLRWSRLPGLDLGGSFPVGHQLPQPYPGFDDRLRGWTWVAADEDFRAPDRHPVIVEPTATMGHRALLVRPDRYIARVAELDV